MEKLTIQLRATQEALQTLEESLDLIAEHANSEEKLREALRDSLIQRFEYSFDTLWKYLRTYFLAKHLIKIDVPTPKQVFTQ